jgi:hypothetical protein
MTIFFGQAEIFGHEQTLEPQGLDQFDQYNHNFI